MPAAISAGTVNKPPPPASESIKPADGDKEEYHQQQRRYGKQLDKTIHYSTCSSSSARQEGGSGGGVFFTGGRPGFRWFEPALQLRSAAIAGRRRRLILALQTSRRATQSDVHMSAMLEPWTDFTQPLAVAARVRAQLLFNRRVDEDAGNFAIFRRQLDKLADLRAP